MGTSIALAWAMATNRTLRIWSHRKPTTDNPDNIYLSPSTCVIAKDSKEPPIDIIHTSNGTHYETLQQIAQPTLQAGKVPVCTLNAKS